MALPSICRPATTPSFRPARRREQQHVAFAALAELDRKHQACVVRVALQRKRQIRAGQAARRRCAASRAGEVFAYNRRLPAVAVAAQVIGRAGLSGRAGCSRAGGRAALRPCLRRGRTCVLSERRGDAERQDPPPVRAQGHKSRGSWIGRIDLADQVRVMRRAQHVNSGVRPGDLDGIVARPAQSDRLAAAMPFALSNAASTCSRLAGGCAEGRSARRLQAGRRSRPASAARSSLAQAPSFPSPCRARRAADRREFVLRILRPGDPDLARGEFGEGVWGLCKAGQVVPMLVGDREDVDLLPRLADRVLHHPGHDRTWIPASQHNAAIDHQLEIVAAGPFTRTRMQSPSP